MVGRASSLWLKAKCCSWNDLSVVLFRTYFHEAMTEPYLFSKINLSQSGRWEGRVKTDLDRGFRMAPENLDAPLSP